MKFLVRAISSLIRRANKTAVLQAIEELLGGTELASSYEFGKAMETDAQVIFAACKAAEVPPLSDVQLSDLRKIPDLVNILCQPREPTPVRGIPKFELFGGADDLPPNIRLINYQKRKWTSKMSQDFQKRALGDASIDLKTDNYKKANSFP